MSLSLRHKHIPSGGVSNSSKSEGQTSEKKEKAASSRLVDEAKVHGFETELISLEKMLHQRQSSDQFKAIGVVGKRGVGKTTLCQVLFNKKEPVQANFLPRIWVCMSWKPNEYKDDHKATIVRRMLTYLGVENNIIDSVYEDRSLSGLLYALHLQLTGKKYLIVLDDAKETEEWFANLDSPITEKEKWGERLAFGLPKGHGGTVIVTSRDEKLAKMMVGEKNLLHLLPLSHPKSCSSIFNDHMKKGQKLENDTEQKEFLKKCAGLPLAATMMGKIKSEELEKAAEKAAKEAAEAAEKAAEKAAKEAAEKAAEKAAKEAAEAAEKAAEKAAKEAAEKAAEKAAKEAAEKAAKEPESPISSKDGEKNKTEELPTEPKPIQPDEAAKSSKDDKKIKSVEVPAGEEPTQQQEKDARSSSKDDEPIKSEEHPAEAEPRPHQEGAAHNETHEEAASGTN